MVKITLAEKKILDAFEKITYKNANSTYVLRPSLREIAIEVGVAVSTVHEHVVNLVKKKLLVECDSRGEARRYRRKDLYNGS